MALHACYARAPAALQSPHVRAGLTPARYCAWLDSNSDAEVWRGVKATLDAYALQQRGAAGGGELCEEYHIMMAIGRELEARLDQQATAAAAKGQLPPPPGMDGKGSS